MSAEISSQLCLFNRKTGSSTCSAVLPTERSLIILTPVCSRTDIASNRCSFFVTKALYAGAISDTAKLAA